MSFFSITVSPFGAVTLSARIMAPILTPFGRSASLIDLPTREEVSRASASITSPKPSPIE